MSDYTLHHGSNWWPTTEQKRHADAGCALPDVCRCNTPVQSPGGAA